MPRSKKEGLAILEKPAKIKKTKSTIVEPQPKYFVDGHSDVREYYEPPKQYEIDWNKIAADVREAAIILEQPKYEQDNGPLNKNQLKQIQKSTRKKAK